MTENRKQILAIIGSTGGIGRALVEHLSARTDTRLYLGARNEAPLREQANELGASFQSLDATDPAQVLEFVKSAGKEGDLVGIANLAGSIFLKPAHATSPEEFDATIAANLRTAFGTVRAAAPAIRKAGVEGLARSAAATYARFGVRVNTVAPGLVRTPMSSKLTANEAQVKASEALHPLGRIGEPTDVAGMISWLLSPASGWVTGQNFGVDGGLAQVRSGR